MTCDTSRPCKRCTHRGLSDTCEDAPRKKKKYLADVPLVSLKTDDNVSPTGSFGDKMQFQSSLLASSYSTPDFPIKQEVFQAPNLAALNMLSTSLYPSQSTGNYLHRNNQHVNHNNVHKNTNQRPAKRSNFLSLAADLEYLTLSGILQENFSQYHSTSNEGTPTSISLSPGVSPQNYNTISLAASVDNSRKAGIALYIPGLSQTPSPSNLATSSKNNSIYDYSFPKRDESINQYFLGPTDGDQVLMFPDVITAIEAMRQNEPSYNDAKHLRLSFTIGIIPEDNHHYSKLVDGESDTFYKEPEEIYAKVTKPFSYTQGYHSLIAYLRNRFPKAMLVQMAESMAAYRPSFIACTSSLKEGDLIFMEQCFQRTLLTYDNFIRVSGTPTIVWRRTGEIAYVGNEFCILTGWLKNDLIGGPKKKFIVELLDDKSVVEYFQLFSRIAFGDFLGATMTECTLLTPKSGVRIRTGCMWTLKRDVFGIPMMIIGNFLPIV